jgi:hypothetical protein
LTCMLRSWRILLPGPRSCHLCCCLRPAGRWPTSSRCGACTRAGGG